MQALPEFKRVVTGHDQQGLAIIASNGPTPMVFILLDGRYAAELSNGKGALA